jgi:acetyltransferase-like isoleucine patch superfamily enzyme
MPGVGMTLIFYFRYGAYISPRAEADLSPRLQVGRKTRISSFVKIKVADGPVHIGQRCAIASGTFISSGEAGTYIGDDCLIGPNCAIVSSSYRYEKLDVPLEKQGHKSLGTHIGNNVFVGSNCSILDGAVIEDNVMIGAQSLVSGRIPKNSIAQGNPVRVAFTRR